jgi:hypothetical protein
MINYSLTKLKPVIRDYGCKSRLPHDFIHKYEDSRIKIEICKICGKNVRFKKHYKGRTDNRAYLEAHARNFAQKNGRTRRLYMKIHYSNKCKIII